MRALVIAAFLVGPPAIAQVSSATSVEETVSINDERLFPKGLTPVTHSTLFFSSTAARASNAGGGAFRLSERFDLSLANAFTLSAGVEYRSSGRTTPELTAKYQFLHEEQSWLNAAAAVKYKMVGLNPDGSEAEAILSLSHHFGNVVAMLNGVVGRGLSEPDVDTELILGVGLPVFGSGFVGLNGEGKFLVGEAAEEESATGGRTYEVLAGAVLGYRFGHVVEASFLAGFLSPIGTTPAGPLGLLTVGISI